MLKQLTLALATAAALSLAATAPQPAQAGTAKLGLGLNAASVESNVTEVGRRGERRRIRRGERRLRREGRRIRRGERRALRRGGRLRGRYARWAYWGPFFAVPYGFARYHAHPCYSWRLGPRGWGYYFNYARCGY